MALGGIVISLDLDDRGFSRKINISERDLRKFGRALGITERETHRVEKRFHSFARTLRDTFIVLGLARAAFHNVISAISILPRVIIQANAEIERMQILMTGMDKTSKTYVEAQEKANQSIRELFALSSRSPFEIGAITDSFVKLKAAGLDPLDGSLDGLINAVAKFGGTNEQLKRASIAIQQMAGKGVISMEELRQQLGEAIPDAMRVMSRATGMEMAEMVKIISEGKLEATSALAAFTNQLQIETEGAAALLASSWTGTINRLKNAWIQFLSLVGGDAEGGYAEAKGALNELVSVMSSPEMQQFAIELGEIFKATVIAIKETIAFVVEYRDAIMLVVAAYAALKVATIADSRLGMDIFRRAGVAAKSFGTGLAGLAQKQYVVTKRFKENGVAIFETTAKTNILKNASRSLGLGIGRLATSIKGLFGPVGWALIAFEGLAAIFYKVSQQKKALDDAMSKPIKLVTQDDLDRIEEEIIALEREMARTADGVKRRADAFRRQQELENGQVLTVGERQRIALEQLEQRFLEGTSTLISRRGQIIAENAIAAMDSDVRVITSKFNESILEMEREISRMKQEGLNPQEISDYYALTSNQATIDKVKETIDLYTRAIANLQNQIKRDKNVVDANKLAAMEQAIANLKEKIQEYRIQLEKLNSKDIVIMDANSQKQITDGEAKLLALNTRLADYQARLAGSGSEVAKVTEFLKENTAIQGDLEAQLLAAAESLDKNIARWKSYQKAVTGANQIERQITRITSAFAALSDRATNIDNPFVRLSSSAKRLVSQAEDGIIKVNQLKQQLTASEASADDPLWAQYDEQLRKLNEVIKNAPSFTAELGLREMINEIEDYEVSIQGASATAQLEFDRQKQAVESFFAQYSDLFGDSAVAVKDRYLAILEDQRKRSVNKLYQYHQDLREQTENMSGLWVDSVKTMGDAMTEFLSKGEMDWKNFLDTVKEMIIRFMVNRAIAQFLGMILGQGVGAAGSGGGSGSFSNQLGTGADYYNPQLSVTGNALGGVMTSRGPIALKKYARGGIARSPQLALFGEGSGAEAYVPLPDGRRIPVNMELKLGDSKDVAGSNVQVNVINQTSQEVDAEQSNPRFDGEKMIVDVVLKAMTRPGPLRETIKSTR